MTAERTWLPRLLFWLTLTVALALVLFVLIAPYLESPDTARGSHDILSLFADDTTLRRTSLGSALGLFVTALVCFQPANPSAKSKGQEKEHHV